MPFCKNCGSRISKFDKELCPVCGQKKPLEGARSDTVEITTELDVHDKDVRKTYQLHFRLNTFLYFGLLGWTGLGFFYLKFKKLGLIWLLSNLLVLGGLITLFIFVISPTNWLTYASPVAIVYLINIGVGVFFLCKNDLKDGNGEFIR